MQDAFYIINVIKLNDKTIWESCELSYIIKLIQIVIDGNLIGKARKISK